MTLCTQGNLNKWLSLLTSILLHEKWYVEKLGYMVKFQEAVRSSGAVSSTCFFPKDSSSHAIKWSKT